MSPRGLLRRLGIAGAVIGAGFLAVAPGRRGYQSPRQASFAPPAWLFAPVWTGIELLGADSVARVLEAETDPDQRRRALLMAGVNDGLYVAFPLVYFRLRSPILAALVTWAQLAAVASQVKAVRGIDETAARELYPQLAWLLYAGPLGTSQALANPDPLFRSRALIPRLGRPRPED